LPAYRTSSPYEQTPLRRRLSGFGLALAINAGLLLVLMTLGVLPKLGPRPSQGIVVDLLPGSRSAAPKATQKSTPAQQRHAAVPKATLKPPPLVLPTKPTISVPRQAAPNAPLPWVEMSKSDMAAGDISKMTSQGTGSEGDSEAVGRGPNGEVLYAAEWARHPTNAELGGYLPRNAPDGYGEIACKTIPGDRVDDCIAIGQSPLGSHLAGAVLNAAWQFRVKPPRRGGKPLIGSWVQIRIDYTGRD
jgi:protein TonB